ncbi:hypothetical protein MUK42_16767 [Musa troglodytarum]|uniref:Uncharacterized protein n=1 Tax=Musa troglodytarum TaxID=320322 RepID=A0A9E7HVT3_9LILI|nr:hypothetical protein MUK42_16767 [Musa troglodytarum]
MACTNPIQVCRSMCSKWQGMPKKCVRMRKQE